MAGALGVVQTTDVPVEGRAAVPCYVDDSLPIVGPSRAVQVVTSGPMAGGPPMAIRLAPTGTPAIGPALPVYIVSGILDSLAYTNKTLALVGSADLLAYWPLADPPGSTIADDATPFPRSGGYGNVVNGVEGIGDGRTATSFSSAAASYCTVYTASLSAAFPTAEGSLTCWVKTTSWPDAVLRRCVIFSVNTSNRVSISVNSVANQISLSYIAGGVTKAVTVAETRTAWLHFALTWSVSADQVNAYVNGTQAGATLTGLGVWAGNLSSAACLIGAANTSGANVLNGQMAHVALWNMPLSAAQIASLATVNTW